MSYDIRGDHAYADIILGKKFKGDWSSFCTNDAVAKSGLTVVATRHHVGFDGAQTMMCVLSESSFIATLSPDGRSARVDCYTCGEEGKPNKAIETVCDAFNGATVHAGQILRGDLTKPGIVKPQYVSQDGLTLAISDVSYVGAATDDPEKNKIKEESAYKNLLRAVINHAPAESIVVLKENFKPSGITAVIAFTDANGSRGQVDLHTYAEQNYYSVTGVGSGKIIFSILKEARGKDGMEKANWSSYKRQCWTNPSLGLKAA